MRWPAVSMEASFTELQDHGVSSLNDLKDSNIPIGQESVDVKA